MEEWRAMAMGSYDDRGKASAHVFPRKVSNADICPEPRWRAIP